MLGLIAVGIAISMSAFTGVKKEEKAKGNFTDYYWFEVKSGFGAQNAFKNAELTYHNAIQPSAPTDLCQSSSTYKCIVGFSAAQVTNTGSTYVVNDVGGSTSITPANTTSFRYRALE